MCVQNEFDAVQSFRRQVSFLSKDFFFHAASLNNSYIVIIGSPALQNSTLAEIVLWLTANQDNDQV